VDAVGEGRGHANVSWITRIAKFPHSKKVDSIIIDIVGNTLSLRDLG